MDLDTTCNDAHTESFSKTVAKSFILSTVSTAGAFGGLLVVGTVLGAVSKRKQAKEPKETAPTEA